MASHVELTSTSPCLYLMLWHLHPDQLTFLQVFHLNDTSSRELCSYHCISFLQTFAEKGVCMAQLACPMFTWRRELLPFTQLLKSHVSLFRKPKWRSSQSRLLHSEITMLSSHHLMTQCLNTLATRGPDELVYDCFLETGYEFLKKTFRSNASCSGIIRDE